MRPALSAPLWGLLALLAAVPLRAGVPEAVNEAILPGYEGFTAATAALDTAARADCSAEALKAPWNAAFDAWMAVSHLRLGPSETDGRALAIAFWPDPKGSGARTQARLLEAADPDLLAPGRFAEVSVAARGLFALERLLYDPAFAGDYACALTRATAADLARMAADLETDWRETFAPLVLTAGRDGNDRFLTEAEARQALFTQLMAGLEFTADQRLGRPLGSFDRPRPERAEARLSGRSLRNVELSLAALERLALALAPDSPRSREGFDQARSRAARLDDPRFDAVADPSGRLRVEILQQRLHALRDVLSAEVGGALGVSVGFNAADGD
ncbi:signal peptidase [Cereibacter sphaeroides]|uniref:imelysin family protein n=1 Tax=Cereibacter sphaeroides TaxID=1063 RepID=UPI000F5401DF|nr:imelysin family protein [Cereibacter sphaeroides]AZB65069.1 signal peptidase [Cereibacter sphaeroides]AZB66990.1 signal peptidase [Cereibacter sphaeroides]